MAGGWGSGYLCLVGSCIFFKRFNFLSLILFCILLYLFFLFCLLETFHNFIKFSVLYECFSSSFSLIVFAFLWFFLFNFKFISSAKSMKRTWASGCRCEYRCSCFVEIIWQRGCQNESNVSKIRVVVSITWIISFNLTSSIYEFSCYHWQSFFKLVCFLEADDSCYSYD